RSYEPPNGHAGIAKRIANPAHAEGRRFHHRAVELLGLRGERRAQEAAADARVHKRCTAAVEPVNRHHTAAARLKFCRALVQLSVRNPKRACDPRERIADTRLAGLVSKISR